MYLYFIHTYTRSNLSKLIGCYTRNKYNHVSISLDMALQDVYSFGRKQPHNPFVGGFVKENLSVGLFSDAECRIYRLRVTDGELQKVNCFLADFETKKENLHYSLLGLVFLSLGLNVKRNRHYFCSEFASELLQETIEVELPKLANLMTPQDIATLDSMEFVFEGKVASYKKMSGLELDGCLLEWVEEKPVFL